MKLACSWLCAVLGVFAVSSVVQAAPEPKSEIKLNEKPAPKWWIATLPAGVRLVRSATAPVGPRGASCWVIFAAKGKAAEGAPDNMNMSVLLPTGPRKWKMLRSQALGYLEKYQWEEAKLHWLNARRKQGFVLQIGAIDDTTLTAFPQGWATKKPVVQTFTGSSSSISALYYSFGEVDKRGFFSVSEIHSEPAMNEAGETISSESTTDLLWNGSGWK